MSSSIQSAAGHVATSTPATTATPAMLPLRDGTSKGPVASTSRLGTMKVQCVPKAHALFFQVDGL